MISYAGVDLPLCTSEAGSWIVANISPWEVFGFEDRQLSTANRLSSGRPKYCPELKLQTLTFPRELSKFASFCFVMDGDTCTQLRTILTAQTSGNYSGEQLIISDGGSSVTTRMFLLPPRPLSGIEGNFYLGVLVDERYYANQYGYFTPTIPSFGGSPLPTKWFDENYVIGGFNSGAAFGRPNGLTGFTYDPVPQAYQVPGAWRQRSYDSESCWPESWDHAARAVGLKYVKNLNGSYSLQNYQTAKSVHDSYLNSNPDKIAGGAYPLQDLVNNLPEFVKVVFPSSNRSNGYDADIPIPHGSQYGSAFNSQGTGGDPYSGGSFVIRRADLNLPEYAGVQGNSTGYRTYPIIEADYLSALNSGPDFQYNLLSDYATQAAKDWYGWKCRACDIRLAGIVNVPLSGFTEFLEFYHPTSGRLTTRLVSGRPLDRSGIYADAEFWAAGVVGNTSGEFTSPMPTTIVEYPFGGVLTTDFQILKGRKTWRDKSRWEAIPLRDNGTLNGYVEVKNEGGSSQVRDLSWIDIKSIKANRDSGQNWQIVSQCYDKALVTISPVFNNILQAPVYTKGHVGMQGESIQTGVNGQGSPILSPQHTLWCGSGYFWEGAPGITANRAGNQGNNDPNINPGGVPALYTYETYHKGNLLLTDPGQGGYYSFGVFRNEPVQGDPRQPYSPTLWYGLDATIPILSQVIPVAGGVSIWTYNAKFRGGILVAVADLFITTVTGITPIVPPAPGGPGGLVIQGNIRYTSNNAPVVGATIGILDTHETGITDSSGDYSITVGERIVGNVYKAVVANVPSGYTVNTPSEEFVFSGGTETYTQNFWYDQGFNSAPAGLLVTTTVPTASGTHPFGGSFGFHVSGGSGSYTWNLVKNNSHITIVDVTDPVGAWSSASVGVTVVTATATDTLTGATGSAIETITIT